MAIKTFTTGEVLTAADTNTYLANAGLVYIAKGTTSTTGVSFNNCFSSTYRSYRVVAYIDSSVSTNNVEFRFRASGSDYTGSTYSWVLTNTYMSGGSAGTAVSGGQTVSVIKVSQKVSTAGRPTSIILDIHGPYVASENTQLAVTSFIGAAAIDMYTGGGMVDQTTQYDGFSLLSQSGNMSAAVEVYGYRLG